MNLGKKSPFPLAAVLLLAALSFAAAPAAAQTDLILSESVEGSSYNKALEVYNPTAAAVDLALGSYSVQIFYNGNTTAGATIQLSGVVAPGGTFVLAHSSASLGITPNQTSSSLTFNGDDAVTLRKSGAVLDSLGQIGVDPGTEWGSGATSTADNTLRRKASVCAGDTDPHDAFDPSAEWDGFAQDTFGGLGSHAASCGSGGGVGASDLFFSEYVEGSSYNKALEIFNGTSASVSLSAYSLEIHFNGSASPGSRIALSGTLAAGDVYVVAHGSASLGGFAPDLSTNSLSFNGDDAVVLVKNGAAVDSLGRIGFDPGTEWGSGSTSTADNTLRRKSAVCAGDADPNDAFDPSAEWDGFARDAFDGLGSHTAGCSGGGGGPAVVEIWQIQGSGTASPLAGQTVTTEDNLVTAVGPDGFFLQTPAERTDDNPATSDGIFVYTGTAPGVSAGDRVDVTGGVVEFHDFTELSGGVTVTVLSSGNPLPAPVALAPSGLCSAGVPELERFEGMSVKLENGTVAGPTDRFGEVAVTALASRPFREPGIACPGLSGLPIWDGNPEVFEIDPDRMGLPNQDLAGAAVVVSAVGGLGYSFGDYQIWPVSLSVVGSAVPGPVRAEAAGELTVGSQNLLRLYDTEDDPSTSDTVATAQQYADRLSKLSLQIRTVLGSPDVLAVSEAENLAVLQDLADRVHADDPSVAYTPQLLEGNDVGGIDVGFLVREGVTVSNVYAWGKDETFTFNGQTSLLYDRPSLVLEVAYTGCGGPFPLTVVAVHLRSLSGIDGSDGERVRAKRHEQATRLSRFLQGLQAADPGIRLVVAGDFNAFEFTDGYVDVMGQVTGNLDPLGALVPGTDEVDPNLLNQTLNVPASERYSFVFGGSAQTLDHALTSQALGPHVRGLQHGRGNADAPYGYGVDPATPLRSSDHDGLVLFLGCTAN